MKIYNSITKQKEEFIPMDGNNVKIYACGVTVYDLSHIGHARQAIVFSMMVDYLRFKGYNVKYVRNYTDVDDKIIKKANELNKDALTFSEEQIKETEKDMSNLHITDADIKTKASEYIEEIIEFVKTLIEKGYAYKALNGDVYYKVRRFKEYGKLSHRNVNDMIHGVRIALEESKEDPIDFALWKSAKPGEIFWESPWGKGRPGWHIECSVMALHTLGETIDIHGGGRDLIFPHHENEIAQSEAYTGKIFSKYWSHCGLIKIQGEKMSKSLGNSLTIRDALKKYNYEVLKYIMLSKHYTSDIDIVESDYQLSEKHLYYFYNTIFRMMQFINQNSGKKRGEKIQDDISSKIRKKFIKDMDDDFNTSAALAQLHIYFKYINTLMDTSKNKQQTANVIANIFDEIKEVYGILGFLKQNPENFIKTLQKKYLNKIGINESYINNKIKTRNQAKENKDFNLADQIRKELDLKGILLKDSRGATTWDLKELY